MIMQWQLRVLLYVIKIWEDLQVGAILFSQVHHILRKFPFYTMSVVAAILRNLSYLTGSIT